MRCQLVRFMFPAIVALVSLGCGGTPTRPGAKVEGVVKVDGKPLPMGSVLMVSLDGKTDDSGSIDEEGRFVIPNAPLGKVKVCLVVPEVPPPTKKPPMKLKGGPQETKEDAELKNPLHTRKNLELLSKIPAKYRDSNKSGLVYEVNPDQNSTFVISIKSR
ncbi:MAG: hypothetical protein HYX68_06945 [Planctomycetes bacterium]|nr:hypothetical protein [Planctomycetota bacterium]